MHTPPPAFTRSHAVPLTAVVLCLLLTACGSSAGGSNRVVSASPTLDSSGTITTGNDTTTPTTPGTATPTPDTGTPAVVTPIVVSGSAISTTHVRGDVLLSMMDQRICKDLVQASAHNGTAVTGEEADKLPFVTGDVYLSPTNYVGAPGAPSPASAAVTCDTRYYTYGAAKAGAYALNAEGWPSAREASRTVIASRLFNTLRITVPLTIGAETIVLGPSLTLNTAFYPTTPADKISSESLTMVAAKDFSFGMNTQVSYGVLNQWNQDTHFTKLMLLRGDTPNEARLCWNIESVIVRRLQCTVWRVPTNWARGQQLERVDQYIVDDRSTIPGESGFLYWRSALAG